MIDTANTSPDSFIHRRQGIHGDIRWAATIVDLGEGSFVIRDMALHLVDGDIRIRMHGDGSRYDSIDTLVEAIPRLIEVQREMGGRIT